MVRLIEFGLNKESLGKFGLSLMRLAEAMHVKVGLIVLMRIYNNVCGWLRKCEVGKWYAIEVG